MSPTFFLDYDSGDQISFSELFDYASRKKVEFTPYLKYSSLNEFYLNLLIALLNDQAITLIDKDFTDSELEKLGILSHVNKSISLDSSKDTQNIVQLVGQIQASCSEITLFTSGTTGLPKKVVHSVSSLTRLVRLGESYKTNIWALAYNPTHMAGLQVFFQSILNGNTLIGVFGLSSEKVIEAIIRYEISHISATPTFYRLLISATQSLDSLERITLGGEKASAQLISDLCRLCPNAQINNIYASTEVGSLFVSRGEDFKVGQEYSSKVKIINNELLIHKSLLNREIEGDWYETGDLVEISSDHPLTFRFVSRKTEMINVGGYKVNPHEVEEVLLTYPSIREVKVYGMKNSVLGNILCADIVPSEKSQISKKALMDYLKKELQDYKIPRILKQVEHIEHTRTGKISRSI